MLLEGELVGIKLFKLIGETNLDGCFDGLKFNGDVGTKSDSCDSNVGSKEGHIKFESVGSTVGSKVGSNIKVSVVGSKVGAKVGSKVGGSNVGSNDGDVVVSSDKNPLLVFFW